MLLWITHISAGQAVFNIAFLISIKMDVRNTTFTNCSRSNDDGTCHADIGLQYLLL